MKFIKITAVLIPIVATVSLTYVYIKRSKGRCKQCYTH